MLVMLLKILNDMTIYTLLERERERERERPGYLSESVPYTWSFTLLHLLHLHTGNLKEHTYEHNNIDHMLDISGHL